LLWVEHQAGLPGRLAFFPISAVAVSFGEDLADAARGLVDCEAMGVCC
jgi:hypothetical protein